MALETIIFQQDPFIYGVKDYNSYSTGSYGVLPPPQPPNADHGNNWESPPSSTVALNGGASTSSPETCGGDGFFSGGGGIGYSLQQQQPVLVVAPHAAASRRKRRRTKSMKNKEEMENQRMTHIAVERNRRRQMNDYLAVLRSLMPPSYAQRGDQASIVGGAINFVKELEQLLQFLEVQNPANQLQPPPSGGGGGAATYSGLFSKFFTFPQYSTSPSAAVDAAAEERRSGVADIEVTVVESHANIKLLTKRRPKQLLKLVAGFQSVYLTILHLNITAAAVDESVLYSFSVKVEDECELTTVNEIATTVHEIVGMIQQESLSSRDNPPHD